MITAEQVNELILRTIETSQAQFNEKIENLTRQLNALNPPSVEIFQEITFDSNVDSGNASLDLIKSLPDFDGDATVYPAWRESAMFAMKYYPENSEKHYVATGILRNKITKSANAQLASFKTVLNFKAILQRLDLTYSDKRPIHVLENELSVLRQDSLSIEQFYDEVDKKLTLILNKQIMSYSGQDELVLALNNRVRETALQVFVSGLRSPLCDILFSRKPVDLPSALATAQELQTLHRRQHFARIHAIGNSSKQITRPYNQHLPPPKQISQIQNNTSNVTPMDVDPTVRVNYSSSKQTRNHRYFNQNTNQVREPNRNLGAIPKRQREHSERLPITKFQRVNHICESEYEAEDPIERESDEESTETQSFFEEDQSISEDINFLV